MRTIPPEEHLRFKVLMERWRERHYFRRGKTGKQLHERRRSKSKTQFVLFADVLGSGQGIDSTAGARHEGLGLMPFMARLFPVQTKMSQPFEIPSEHLVIVQFHHVLNRVSGDFYPWQIIAFSDSAYVIFERPEDVVLFASQLMVALQSECVPARMGIGAGTFATIRFDRQEALGRNYYAAQFAGSGIVHAYHAESRGGRVFAFSSTPQRLVTSVTTGM